jgi:hypothetical protein
MLSLEQLFCLAEFCKDCVEVRNNGCFRDLRAIGLTRGPETGFFTKILRYYQKIRPKTRFLELGASVVIYLSASTQWFYAKLCGFLVKLSKDCLKALEKPGFGI